MWQAEIERLQTELLQSSSHQQPVMSSDGDVMDGLSHDDIEQTVGTESAAVIDSLKCQLQQSTLAQQTTNIQLAAIKQVLPYLLTVHCVLGVKFGSPSHMLVRFSLAERTVPVLLRPLGSYRQIVATGKKEDDKINSLSKVHIYFYQWTNKLSCL